MGSWFVKPEAVRVELSDGQWLILKKRLTEGERRKMLGSLVTEIRGDGRMTPQMEMVGGKAETLAYLLEWSLCDEQGLPVKIDTEAKKLAAIDALDPDAFQIISNAVSAHVDRMDAERDAEKKAAAGASASSATSPSAA
jgi:hypothetical protein